MVSSERQRDREERKLVYQGLEHGSVTNGMKFFFPALMLGSPQLPANASTKGSDISGFSMHLYSHN